ncbi:MAG: signal peptidase II [Lachnospiraceae bacterium]|nr:signal peptidase II [Lachnospiraceae bacterium]
MTKRPAVNLIIDAVIMCLLIVADQYTKALAVVMLKDKPAIPIISGILEFNYLENRGAAFGMMQNQKIFFIFVAVIILGCIIYMLVKAPAQKKYMILHILLVFIAAGAIGNMIDRLSLNYVVDFIYIKAINFPIFNVADIYVTVSTILLAIVLVFVYKDDDLRFMSFRASGFRTFDDDRAGQRSEEVTDSVKETKDNNDASE